MIRILEGRIENLEKELAALKESNLQRDIQITNLMTSISGLLRMGQSKERVTFGSQRCKEEDIGKILGGLKPKTFLV